MRACIVVSACALILLKTNKLCLSINLKYTLLVNLYYNLVKGRLQSKHFNSIWIGQGRDLSLSQICIAVCVPNGDIYYHLLLSGQEVMGNLPNKEKNTFLVEC